MTKNICQFAFDENATCDCHDCMTAANARQHARDAEQKQKKPGKALIQLRLTQPQLEQLAAIIQEVAPNIHPNTQDVQILTHDAGDIVLYWMNRHGLVQKTSYAELCGKME